MVNVLPREGIALVLLLLLWRRVILGVVVVHRLVVVCRHVVVLERGQTAKSIESRQRRLLRGLHLNVLVRGYYLHRHMLIMGCYFIGQGLLSHYGVMLSLMLY